MITNPKINQLVQLKYNKKKWPTALLQGKIGTIVLAGKGKPRNHAVNVEGVIYIVPCGNIFSLTEKKIIGMQPEQPIQLKLFSS